MTLVRILVVEDDRVVVRDIKQQLVRVGYTVVGTTPRGEDVVSLALETRPDLVLMDIRLEGGTDGIDAAQQIRERLQIPVIYLTAYADELTLQRAKVTDPFGYLVKPFQDSQLRTAIEMALYKHATERRLRASERRYAVTLSSIGDAVIATDELAQITFMNPVAEALTGWPLASAVGRPLGEVFRLLHEQSRPVVEEPAARCAARALWSAWPATPCCSRGTAARYPLITAARRSSTIKGAALERSSSFATWRSVDGPKRPTRSSGSTPAWSWRSVARRSASGTWSCRTAAWRTRRCIPSIAGSRSDTPRARLH